MREAGSKYRQGLLTKALAVLRREKREPVALGIPAIHGGLARPPYLVALIYGPYEEYHTCWVDTKGLTELWSGGELLDAMGQFVTLLYTGDPSEFDMTQR